MIRFLIVMFLIAWGTHTYFAAFALLFLIMFAFNERNRDRLARNKSKPQLKA